jgi:hypothetical protein
MAQCMAMGQAAGTAAALAARRSPHLTEVAVRDVPAAEVRSQLAEDGAILDLTMAPAR